MLKRVLVYIDIIYNFVIIVTMIEKTCISVRREIRNQLASLGNKDSTFDQIIQMLIEHWRKEN